MSGSSSQLASAVTLTGSAVASASVYVGGMAYQSLELQYTPGVSSGNALSVTVESSNNDLTTTDANSKWEVLGRWSDASGTLTQTDYAISIPATGTSLQTQTIELRRACQKIRIKYSETGSPTPFGTLTANLLSSNQGGQGNVSSPVSVTGTTAVGGDVAHDAVDSGNPVKVGGQASTTPPTAVSVGDRVNTWHSTTGQVVVTSLTQTQVNDGSSNSVVGHQAISGTGVVFPATSNFVFNGTTWDRMRSGGVTGMAGVSGDTAHDAVDAGNPVKIGGKATVGTTPTTVSNGDRVDAWLTGKGAQMVSLVGTTAATDGLSNANVTLALANSDANAAPIVGPLIFNGTTWDRQRNGGVTGMTGVSGDTAHDAVDAGNPVKIGGRAIASTPSNVSAGDRTDITASRCGYLNVCLVNGSAVLADGATGFTYAHDVGGSNVAVPTAGYLFNGSSYDRVRSGGVTGMIGVSGDTAHDAADTGNPQKVGAKARATLEDVTLVASNDRTNLHADLDGALIVRPHVPHGDQISERVSNTDGNATAFSTFGAGGSTARNYITDITVHNSHASTNGYVDIRDGTGGAVLWTLPAPAIGGTTHHFDPPLRQPTTNTALAYEVSAAISTVFISVNGYQSNT